LTEISAGCYGKDLAGWFFDDGCVYYPLNPDFRRLTEAAKTGHAGRLVCYNPWVLPRMTDFQDYLCGGGYDFLKFWDGLPADGTGIYTSGPHKGLQAHTNFVLERATGPTADSIRTFRRQNIPKSSSFPTRRRASRTAWYRP
jgi:hypothetical protein